MMGFFISHIQPYLFFTSLNQDDIDTINLIDKNAWDKHFITRSGQSMEAKSYAEALKAVYSEYGDSTNE